MDSKYCYLLMDSKYYNHLKDSKYFSQKFNYLNYFFQFLFHFYDCHLTNSLNQNYPKINLLNHSLKFHNHRLRNLILNLELEFQA